MEGWLYYNMKYTDKQIVFTEKNKADLLEVECRPVGDYDVKVKTCFTTISSGTEKANITGCQDTSPFTQKGNSVIFPRVSGYSASGIVVEKGSCVDSLEIGDKVAISWSNHRKYNVVNEKQAVKFDEGVTMEEASMAHIATFSLAAIRKARIEIGESAMVTGLGILGLVGVGLLRVAGAIPIIAVDPIEERRKKALLFGADYAFDPYDKDFYEKVKEVSGGGVNVAIEVTGNGAGLNVTLDCMKKFGRVSLLGCTRDSNFTVDYYRKVHGPGISLIGAHTMARPQVESSPTLFTVADDMKTVLSLCSKGRIDLKSIIDETYSPTECEGVYKKLVNDKTFPTVVQFDWSEV